MSSDVENSEVAVKFDSGKPRMSTVPQLALMEVAKVFTYGANKYAAHNYSKGMEYSRYIDACHRHINAYLTGEDIDESGCYHIGHAIASLMMLMDNQLTKTGNDDRNETYKKMRENNTGS